MFFLLCSKFTAKYRTFLPTLFFMIIGITYFSLPLFISFENLPSVEIVIVLTLLVFVLICRNGNIWRKIFWVCFAEALLFGIIFVSVITISVITKVSGLDIMMERAELSIARLQVIVMVRTLHLIIFYALARSKKHNEVSWNWSLAICFVIPLITFISVIIIYEIILKDSNYGIPDMLIYVVSVTYLIVNIIVFVLYELINKEAEKNYMLMAKQNKYEMTEQHNHQILEIYSNVREWRHDYANHMQLIMSLLENPEDKAENNKKAVDYIKNLDKKITESSSIVSTGNYIADAIISAKMALAHSFDINFEYKSSLPDILPIDETDLCVLLSNLLDNAIEACCKVEDNRYIHLKFTVIKTQLEITLKNSADGKYIREQGVFKTTKRGGLHGIGMRHIASIVEKYNGIYKPEAKETFFKTWISIPLVNKDTIK